MIIIKRISKEKIKEYLLNFNLTSTLDSFFAEKKTYATKIQNISIGKLKVNKYINEFWTSRQRQSSSIHEISYRACFKAQLPRFFIELLTNAKDLVYDPFSGRGTTVIEAGLMVRNIISNDINPLSEILTYPRFFIPSFQEVKERLKAIDLDYSLRADIDLSMFYHPRTEAEIVSLRNYLMSRKESGKEDKIDKWIRMVATNRLTGHSKGFFSVYTLPPNQAVSPERQSKINQERSQEPEYREIKKRILTKTKSLTRTISFKDKETLAKIGKKAQFSTLDARNTLIIEDETVDLTVTSPPFLDVVNYLQDNWLRCWFNEIDVEAINKKITVTKSLQEWCSIMKDVFAELFRITKKQGFVAFEVGEVRKGRINLDEHVVPLGVEAGFESLGVIINLQEFTKTANIWGVNNLNLGTNTNRIALFVKQN